MRLWYRIYPVIAYSISAVAAVLYAVCFAAYIFLAEVLPFLSHRSSEFLTVVYILRRSLRSVIAIIAALAFVLGILHLLSAYCVKKEKRFMLPSLYILAIFMTLLFFLVFRSRYTYSIAMLISDWFDYRRRFLDAPPSRPDPIARALNKLSSRPAFIIGTPYILNFIYFQITSCLKNRSGQPVKHEQKNR